MGSHQTANIAHPHFIKQLDKIKAIIVIMSCIDTTFKYAKLAFVLN